MLAFSLSRSLFLPLRPEAPASLSPSRLSIPSHQFQHQKPFHHHQKTSLIPSITVNISGEGRSKSTVAASTDRRLPTPFPATTGHYFQRHHDQKNHLNFLYTKVLIVSPFFVLEKSAFYCSSPPFCIKTSRLLFATCEQYRVGLCARPGQ